MKRAHAIRTRFTNNCQEESGSRIFVARTLKHLAAMDKVIYTIGHSTHPIGKFIAMLNSFSIDLVADIRAFPASRRFPYFNRDALEKSLGESSVHYVHMPGLGGRRKPAPNSQNSAWRVEGFRGYADYMETDAFVQHAAELEKLAESRHVAYMCAEAVWWSCHRALLSDYLQSRGWIVRHIMTENKSEPHRYSKPARIVNGKLTYHATELFGDQSE
jgi:uncharacterized protein (DUF488 family)